MMWDPPLCPPPVDFPALVREAAPTRVAAGGVESPSPPPAALPPAKDGASAATASFTPTEALTGRDDFGRLVAEALERAVPSSGRLLQPHQIPPRAHDDPTSPIKGWVMLAGRNAGKSYAGARWLHRMCNVPGRPKRCRVIAPSFGDAVASCVEGPSGLIEASGGQAVFKPSHPGGAQVQWPNGSVCFIIGTPTPRDVDRLRAVGNIDYDWFEEAAANPQLKEAERQARLSRRRLGSKWIATTTPRPLPEVRAWKAASVGETPTVVMSEATAYDNPFADPLWLEELETTYAGTLLYQQEVLGKVLEDVAGAIWNLTRLERSRVYCSGGQTPLEAVESAGYRIIKTAIGVDPANSSGLTGIVAVALAEYDAPGSLIIAGHHIRRGQRHLLVLEDCSTPGMSAETWAAEAVRLAYKYDAPIVAENDSGGDAIRAVLKAADHLDRVTIVPARARGRGPKGVRAEPIALLWERDDYRGHIVGNLVQLEEQMTTWVPDDKATAGPTGSPDRVDAMVWAGTYLWTQPGASDVEVHLPSHMRSAISTAAGGSVGEDLLRPHPGQMAPWARAKRHSKPRR